MMQTAAGRDTAPMTVADLLDSDLLTRWQPEVVAGRSGLGRVVRWMHVAEASDVGVMLSGGEAILTTGVLLASTQLQERYVEWLEAGSAATLIIGLGRAFQKAPEALSEAAQRYRLPLIVLHRPTPFSSLVEQVQSRIINNRNAETEISDRLRTRLLALIVNGCTRAQLLDEIAAVCQCPVVMQDPAGRALASAGEHNAVTDVLRDWERIGRRLAGAEPQSRTAFYAQGCAVAPLVDPLGVSWGRLVLVGLSATSALSLVMAQRASELVAVQRLAEGTDRDLASVDDLLAALANGSASAESLSVSARAIGLPVHRRTLIPLVISNNDSDASMSADSQLVMARSVQRMATLLGQHKVAAMHGTFGSVTTMLVSLPASVSPDVLDRTAHQAREEIRGEYLTPPIVAAGYPCRSISQLQGSFTEAARVGEAAMNRAGTAHPSEPHLPAVVRLADVRLGGLVRMLRDQPEVQEFIDRTLAPIAEHPDLMQVLRAFLHSGSNKAVTAQSQHRSRASVYRKLDQIAELLGTDLTDPEQLTALHLALVAHDARHGYSRPGSA